jgi:hypothetical protein
MRHCIETTAPWLPKEEAEILIYDYSTTDRRYIWPSQAELREEVWISDADRTRLGVRQIPPWDMTKEQLEQRKKDKKRIRKMKARRKAGA